MDKENLLFYKEYEMFYEMADKSEVFREYCEKAFGADFSQDGFSDLSQLKELLSMVTFNHMSNILDIGCGNGKMIKYIQRITGAYITGFDYSEKAIASAKRDINEKAKFEVGIIGQIDYQAETFDLIISMDTIYFATDMNAFVSQIYNWLRNGGHFICGYQEGDVMKKTANKDTTELAKSFRNNGIEYEVIDYTRKTYEMLKNKRDVILSMKDKFINSNMKMWYKVVKRQTQCVKASYEKYQRENARYIYIVKK
jgi:2-polyprenyl-3-methyl-5-hydroxy-6-metoxy-1,4-benzoquinol methylase